MVQSITRSTLIGIAVAGAFTIGVALPAWADHTGGAELTDIGSAGETSCYVGGLLSGIPATLSTPNYDIRDYAGKRHIVCYFETAASYTADPEGGGYDWNWTAPTIPTTFYGSANTCVEPGGSGDGYTEAAQSTPRFVQYKTHLVMYCSWALADLAYP